MLSSAIICNCQTNWINTQYMRNPTIVSPFKMEYGWNFSISGLKMMDQYYKNLYLGPPRSNSNSSDLWILCSNQFQKKNQNYYCWTLVDPNKGCSYSEKVYWISRTPAFVWVGLDCICWTVSSIPDQCATVKKLLNRNSQFRWETHYLPKVWDRFF